MVRMDKFRGSSSSFALKINTMGLFNTRQPPFFSPRPRKEKNGRIAIFYYLPKKSRKFQCWNDGFVGAMQILSAHWEIDWIHAGSRMPVNLFRRYDAILVKSNWGWIVDSKIQKWKPFISSPCFLVLSGSLPPTDPEKIKTYTHVFYESRWYETFRRSFASSSYAFGVNTDVYSPGKREKKWDIIGVGALKSCKRWDRLAERPGRKLVVGDTSGREAEAIRLRLEGKGVEVRGFQSPETLRELMLASHKAYIPAEIQGGGERAVWEARACGIPIEVEADNPKLKEFLSGPVLSHRDYAQALHEKLKIESDSKTPVK